MSFIKLKAEKIFDGYRYRTNEALVLQADGTVEGFMKEEELTDLVHVDGILCPGFINCHCHLELSHLKGMIAEETGLLQFVREVVQKRNLSEDKILEAIEQAEIEMRDQGIVAVGDICNNTDTIQQKSKNNLFYHNFIEVLGADPNNALKIFGDFEKNYHSFCQVVGKHRVSLTPHAPYSVSKPLWQRVVNYPGNHLLSIHNQETEDENLWFQNKIGGFEAIFQKMGIDSSSFQPSGKTSIQTYLHNFLPGQQVLLVHNVYTSEIDIQFTKELPLHLFWCLCPNANQYISNRMPDIPMFIENNCAIVLGTDSLASNHQLSIWEEIKTIQTHFPGVKLEEMLTWATINGARALQADEKLGSFEKGKKPGVLAISPGTLTEINRIF